MQKTWIHEKADKNHSGGRFFFVSSCHALQGSDSHLNVSGAEKKEALLAQGKCSDKPSHTTESNCNKPNHRRRSYPFSSCIWLTVRGSFTSKGLVSPDSLSTLFIDCYVDTTFRPLSQTSMKNLQRMVTTSFVDSICQILCLWKSNLG